MFFNELSFEDFSLFIFKGLLRKTLPYCIYNLKNPQCFKCAIEFKWGHRDVGKQVKLHLTMTDSPRLGCFSLDIPASHSLSNGFIWKILGPFFDQLLEKKYGVDGHG